MVVLLCFIIVVIGGFVSIVSGVVLNLKNYELVGNTYWVGWVQIAVGAVWIISALTIVTRS